MGLDVSFGTIYGVSIYDTLVEELGRKTVQITKYNSNTGKPYLVNDYRFEVKLNFQLGTWKKGRVVEDEQLHAYLREVKDKYYDISDDTFILGTRYFGFRSHMGDTPYMSPQDWSFELVSCVELAKDMWNKEFPFIPGTNRCFLYTSF